MQKKSYPLSRITGVDIDKKILKIARKKIKEQKLSITLKQAGADRLPFQRASVDVVVSTLVFHHLPEHIKKRALKEIYRILKKKGKFILIDFGKAEIWYIKLLFLLEKLLKIPEADTSKDNFEGKIPSLLRDEGFSFKEQFPRFRGIHFIVARKH